MREVALILLALSVLACKKKVMLYLIETAPVTSVSSAVSPAASEPSLPPDDEPPVPGAPIATETTKANLITFNMRESERVLNRCYEVDTRTFTTYGLKNFSRLYQPGEADGPHVNSSFTKIGEQEYNLIIANPDEFKCLRSNAGAVPLSVAGETFLTLEIIGIIELGRDMLYTAEEENNAGRLSFTLVSEVSTVIVSLPGRPQVNGVDLSGRDPNYDISSVAALNSKSPKVWSGRRVYGYKRLLIQNTCGASALKSGEKTVLILRAKDLAKPTETQVIRVNIILR